MNNEQAVQFRSYLEEYYETREYSGRSMFGKKCIAIMVPNYNEAIWTVAMNMPDNLKELEINYPRVDNLGRDYVVYWPSIPYVEEEEEDPDDE